MIKSIMKVTLLSFVIIVIMTGAVSAAGYSGYTGYGFTSNSVTVDAGDTFDLYLEAGSLQRFGSLRFSVQFDESVLTLKNVVLNPDDEVPGYMMSSPKKESPVIINWIHTEPYAGYANYAKFTFEVNDDAYSGTYYVNFETYSSESLFYNSIGELIQADGTQNVAAQSAVTVEGKKYTAVSDIKLNKTTLDLAEDEYETLRATISPSGATVSNVTWSSSDPDVAKVSTSGKVTAVSDGVAVIYAKADGVTVECQVTVDTPHVCSYTQKSTADKYLKYEATCESPASYYYSCACGEAGTKTFNSGGLLDHIFNSNGVCAECGYEEHSCSYSIEWKNNADEHWRACECGKVRDKAEHYDENTDGKCDVCRYSLPQKVDKYTVTGTVTSSQNENEDILIELIPEGKTTAAYSTTVKGNNTQYIIKDVAPGTYTMRVSKKNHVTRTYTIIVG